MISELIKQVIMHKAKLMKGNPLYSKHLGKLLKELKIVDIKEAALLGAIDAMIYDVACSLGSVAKKYVSGEERKSLLKELRK